MATDDLVDQAAAAEQSDLHDAQQLVSDHAVQKEQDGYAATIAQNNAAKPPVAPVASGPDADSEGMALGHGTQQVLAGAYKGVVSAIGELGNAVIGLASGTDDQAAWARIGASASDPRLQEIGKRNATISSIQTSVRAGVDASTPTIDSPEGQAAQGIAQFTAGFIPAARVLKAAEGASTVQKVAAAAAAAGVTQAAVFNPNDERMSNMVQKFPGLKNPVNEFLASKPGDSDAEGRLKNFLEGFTGGALTDGAVQGFTAVLRAMRASRGLADSVKATAAAAPTNVTHVSPQPAHTPATIAEADHGVEVHSQEMTDEQWKQFQGLRSHVQADEGLGADSQGATEQPVRAGSGGKSAEAPHPEEGRPLTVFRGSQAPLEDSHFQPEALGHQTGRPSSGLGVFFTNNPEEAARYGDVTQHHLDIQNPKVYKVEDVPGFNTVADAHAHQQELRRAGYDGITIDASHLGGDVNHVAFDPAQVRDAGTGARSAPVEAPPKPYEPPTVTQAESSRPSAPEQPAAIPGAPKVFDPAATTRNAIRLPPEKVNDFLQALKEGRYNDTVGVLDDTHRTIPWETLSDGANLKGMFNAMTDHFGTAIRAAAGPAHVSDKMVAQLAKDIGGDVGKLQDMYSNVTDQGGLAAQITAGYNMMVASGRQLNELASVAHGLNATTEEGKAAVFAFQKQVELHAAIVGEVRQSSTEIARALAAHRALKASTQVSLNGLNENIDSLLGPNALKKYLKDSKGATDLASINNAVDKSRGNGFWNVIKMIAQNGMISNPLTQTWNIASNTAKFVSSVAERYLAGTIGDIRGVLMQTSDHASIRSAIAHTTGQIQGVMDSFPLAVKALSMREEPLIGATGKPVQFPGKFDTEHMPAGLVKSGAEALNVAGAVIRYPGRAMGAFDHLNTGAGAVADLHAKAYVQSAIEADAKGLRGDERTTFMLQRQQEMIAKPTTEMREAASMEGLRQSFLEPPQTVLGAPVAKALNAHPLVKLIVAPFIQRPMNMLRQSIVDYTALGLGSEAVRMKLVGGGADMDLALTRMTIGTSAIMWAYHRAAEGGLIGSRLGTRNTEALDGLSDSLIKGANGKWYKYDRLDPAGMWLHIGADIHEAISRWHDPNDPQMEISLGRMVRMGIQTIGMAAMEKSFMKSADDLMKAMTEKNGAKADTLFDNLVTQNVAKLVPFSGALRGAARAVDPTIRVSDEGDIWGAIKKGMPWLNQDLAPSRDVLGRPRTQPGGTDSWWNPFSGTSASTSHVDQELSKLAVAIKTPPRQLENITLNARQYDEILTNATQKPIFPGKMNLEQYVSKMVNSHAWTKLNTTDDNGVVAHTRMVQEVIDAAYKYGGDQYMQDHKEFRALMINQAKIQAAHFKTATPAAPATTPALAQQ